MFPDHFGTDPPVPLFEPHPWLRGPHRQTIVGRYWGGARQRLAATTHQITLPDGTTGYTRDGSFKEDANGSIVTAEGYFVQPQITIPQNATSVNVASDGTVTAQVPGAVNAQTLGQLQLAR